MIDEKFRLALGGFLEKWQATIRKWNLSYMILASPTLQFKKGKRYVKITKIERNATGGSVEAFINMSTGDIFKSASCNAPAKHARGNVFSEYNGMEAIDQAGYVKYRRN